jgi:hypothetical protein
MSQFDFISVLVSIVFGLGLTHLCAGAFQLAYRRQLGAITLLLSAFTFVVLVLNWWMFFGWHDRTNWTFEALLVLVAWAMSFYGIAIALFPPGVDDDIDSDTRHRGFAIGFLVTLVLDVIQTALLGTLFKPWYYLPFVAENAACAVVIHRAMSRRVKKAFAWWLLVSMLLWALVVRRYLGG